MPRPDHAPRPPKTRADTRRITSKLFAQHPGADTELDYRNAYELLVATILSAQCTDERVNQVTPALFERYPDARALAAATAAELEPQIQSTGFFRAKSRALIGMANALADRHGGVVPGTMDELVELPGVGRKTANVVLGHALGVPGLPVDRHVLRVANRIGIASSDDPEIVEAQLCDAMPREDWTLTSDTLILHGRRICKPRPLCERCAVREECNYYRAVVRVAAATPSAGRRKQGSTRQRRGHGGAEREALSASPSGGNTQASGSLAGVRGAAKPRRTVTGAAPPNALTADSSPGVRRAAKPQKGQLSRPGPPSVLKADRSPEYAERRSRDGQLPGRRRTR